MRNAILILLCVAAIGFAAWRVALSIRGDSDEVELPPGPISSKPVVPVVPVGERFAKALTDLDIAALEMDSRPPLVLRILTVAHGSAAELKGIKIGDDILKLDGQPVTGTKAFIAERSRKAGSTVTFWMQGAVKDITFSGLMGVTFQEELNLDRAYIQSHDRNANWDKTAVVAARLHEPDPLLAQYALAEAQKAGYAGWLVPVVSVSSNFMLSRHDEALKFLAGAKSVPTVVEHFWRKYLYRSAVLAGRFDLATDLEKQFDAEHLRPEEWDMDLLFARYRALSDSERAMIGTDGNLKHAVARDLSKSLLKLDANSKIALDYMNSHSIKVFGVNIPENQFSIFKYGPFTQNARLKIAFNFEEWQKKLPAPRGHFCIGICDVFSRADEPLAELLCTHEGGVELLAEGYPRVQLSKELMQLNGDNKIEAYVSGPWIELWLNGQNVFRGVTPVRERELYFRVVGSQVQGKFKDIEYGELDAGAWKPQAPHPADAMTKPDPPIKIPGGDLKWFHDTYVGGYLEHGRRNAAWDADVVEALALTSRYEGRDASADPTVILAACKRAVAQGCDDPLLLKVCGDMICFVEESRAPSAARLFKQAGDAIVDTKYSDVLKFLVIAQCARFEFATGLDPIIERASARLATATKLISAAFDDKNAPGWFVRSVFVDNLALPRDGHDRIKQITPLLSALESVPRAKSVALTLKGQEYIAYAWDARGSGWASTVTPEGWKLFHERLDIAKQALTKAWELDSTNSTAMEKLITIAMAGESDIDAPACFLNAVSADRNNVGAYDRMLQALAPKWSGNAQLQHQFAQKSFDQVKHDSSLDISIAKVLLTAHVNMSEDAANTATEDQAQRNKLVDAYWEKPEVWPEIDKVFKLIMERAPTNLAKSEYAFYAARCKKWDVARKLFDELGPNLAGAPFGGRYYALEQRKKAKEIAPAKLAAEIKP